MFSKCANPSCRVEFDYHKGEFFRFRKQQLRDGQPANTHSVQHLWLCSNCVKMYCLEYQPGKGILLRLRFENATRPGLPQLVAAA